MKTGLVLGLLLLLGMVAAASDIPNCGTQTAGSTECSQCQTGYGLSQDKKTCRKCDVGCANCGDVACVTCLDQFYLYNGLCRACEYGCATCDSANCLSCLAGFNLLTNTGSAQRCIKCPNNCKECKTSALCTTCNQGYKIQTGTANDASCILDTTPASSSITTILLLAIGLVLVVSCCFWYHSTFGEASHKLQYENQELLDQFYSQGAIPVGTTQKEQSSSRPKFEPLNKVPFQQPPAQPTGTVVGYSTGRI